MYCVVIYPEGMLRTSAYCVVCGSVVVIGENFFHLGTTTNIKCVITYKRGEILIWMGLLFVCFVNSLRGFCTRVTDSAGFVQTY